MAELAAWLFTVEGATTAAAVATATAATVSAAQAGGGGAKLPPREPPGFRETETELSAYKQRQRDLIRKRRASLATTMKLEEPKLGKQSLLGA